MTRSFLTAAAFVLLAAASATAQEESPAPTQNGGAGVRAGNISATGRTMPNVGASKGAGTTSLDKGIQAEDNKISSSICKGC